MGKIRVQDLAQKMGIGNQDLIFKLRSIGVRVDSEDTQIDTEVIQAILQGKKMAQPREVILRDEEAPPGPVQRRRTPQRHLPPNPLRPARRRTMIQRVEPKIRTLPATSPERSTAAASSAPAPAAPAVEETTKTATAEAQVETESKAAGAPTGTAEVAKAGAPTETRKRPTRLREAREGAPGEERPPTESKRGRRGATAQHERPKKPGRSKRAVALEQEQDLQAYRGSVKEIEAARERAEEEEQRPVTGRGRRRVERRKEQQEAAEQGQVLEFKKPRPEGPITISEGMTVRDFSDKLGIKSKDLIKRLFDRGMMATINHVLEPELAQELAGELGFEARVVSFEEEIQLQQVTQDGSALGKSPRPPVVTIMGHVDHGKTSLLDAIRSSRITESESGGITQHIGAYQVEINDRKIVFLDTPGHEAFTKLRARGAQVTDVVVLVVAADDSVMPQTVEAIDHAKAAGVPILIAINKVDKPNANLERVKKDLADHGLTVEEWGGDTVAVPIAAIKGEGIGDLLEMILLTADLLELKADADIAGRGVVLEARREAGRGTVSTVLLQSGTLRVGDVFVSGSTWGRVRAMMDDLGRRVEEAEPSTPVEVSGFNELPDAGDAFQVLEEETRARGIAEFRREEQRARELAPTHGGVSLERLFDQIEMGQVKELPVIIKADVQGSVEVLKEALEKISTEKVKVRVILAGVGAVSTNDVLLASASQAIIFGFNVRPERNAAELADKEEVDIRLHTVIYELSDELRNAMTGLLEPTYREVDQGRAEVREIFKVPKVGTVAGCHVVDGTIPRTALVRLLRDNVVIYEGKIGSLKRFKDDVSEVRSGFDCGIGLERFQDVKPGDMIEAYSREEVAPTL